MIDELVAGADPGIVASAGPRYFGFVTGGALPAALAADWLASAWDQNAHMWVGSPAASVVEEVVEDWVLSLLGLPSTASVGLVTGAQMANVTCLAVARDVVLERAGWDAASQGLIGAPPVTVIAGAEAHATIFSALRMIGLGRDARPLRRRRRPGRDRPGRARPRARGRRPGDRLRAGGQRQLRRVRPARADRRTCASRRARGCTSTARSACGRRRARRSRHLTRGLERADSWATDAHKWLNVPYDGGLAIVNDRAAHRARDEPLAPPTSSRASSVTTTTTRPRRRAAPAGSRSTPRCARSAATASPSWSSATARRPRASPRSSRRRRRDPQRRRAQPGARRRPAERRRAHPGRRDVLGAAGRSGAAARRSGSRCPRTGRRPTRTWNDLRARFSRRSHPVDDLTLQIREKCAAMHTLPRFIAAAAMAAALVAPVRGGAQPPTSSTSPTAPSASARA